MNKYMKLVMLVVFSVVIAISGSNAQTLMYGNSSLSAEQQDKIHSQEGSKSIPTPNSSAEDEWERMRIKGDVEGVMKAVLTLKDPKLIGQSLNWLDSAFLDKGETNYMFPVIHATQLHRIGYMGGKAKLNALAMVQYARLLLKTDSVRCDDVGVGSSAMFTMMRSLKPVLLEVKDLPYNVRKMAVDIALKLEEANKNRKKNAEICMSGMGYISRAVKNKNTIETVTEVNGTKITNIDGGAGERIDYISDSEWYKKREKIRDKFRSSLSKDK